MAPSTRIARMQKWTSKIQLPKIPLAFETRASSWFASAKSRLAATTPRERLLLGAMATAALLYAPLAAFEWRNMQEDKHLEAVASLTNAQMLARSLNKANASSLETAAFKDMRGWGFSADNTAIARVRIEQRLIEAATNSGLTNVEIAVGDKVDMTGPVQWLDAEVQSDLLWKGAFDFLDDLSSWPEGFRITAFRYEQPPQQEFDLVNNIVRAGKLRMTVSFPVKIAHLEVEK